MSRLDDGDFEQFVESQLPRLKAFARVLTGNDHDAWDLVQDSLVRVGGRWQHITNGADPYAYVHKTMVNQNLNRLRRRRREIPLAETPDRAATGEPLSGGFENAWLESALARLSKRQRAAVVLAYMEDQSVAQIADILGCSPSAAKTHLARGRAVLRAAVPGGPTGASPARATAHLESGGVRP